jgi:hypothetical protein
MLPKPVRPPRTTRRILVVVGLLLALAGFSAFVIFGGVWAAAIVVGRVGADEWNRRGNAGDSFGVVNTLVSGLAFVALIITLWIQFHELRLQRAELRMQREAIERSNSELHSSAAADTRALHVELMKLSIHDEKLAEVWLNDRPLPPDLHRQYLYANLIFQNIALTRDLAGYSEEQMRRSIRLIFHSPIIREYWLWAAPDRAVAQVPGTTAWMTARIGNEVYREFHPGVVLADDPPADLDNIPGSAGD